MNASKPGSGLGHGGLSGVVLLSWCQQGDTGLPLCMQDQLVDLERSLQDDPLQLDMMNGIG